MISGDDAPRTDIHDRAVSRVVSTRRPGSTREPFDRYLVPIVPTFEPVPGAYGSLWMTELYVRNESDSAMDLWRASEFCGIECPPFTAHSTEQRAFTGEANVGTFIYVGASSRNRSTFQLSVRDISRAETTWGASIPVVPEWQAYPRKLQLLNVPTDPAFRVALRIYDFDPDLGSERSVRLRIFPIGGNDAIVDMPVVFPASRSPGTLPMVPGTVMIGDLAAAFRSSQMNRACASMWIR